MNLRDSLDLGWSRRLPMILQTEAAECALACLAMIASHYGQRFDLVELRRRFGMSLRGATLQDVVRIADLLSMASRPLRLELKELGMLRTPCILHWDLNHFVVLKSVRGTHVVVHDPAVGMRRMPLTEVSRHFTGVALELTPLRGFESTTPPPQVRIRALIGHIVGLRGSLVQLFMLALCIEVFAIASPLFMQWVVDHALVTGDRDLLVTLAMGFALLLVIRVSVSAMRGWMLIALGAMLKVQGRANLFSHLIRLPASYFETRYLGDVMSRFGSQDTILTAISTDVIETILDGLLGAITLVVMLLFAPALTGVVLIGTALYAAMRWTSFMPLRQASEEAIVWAARRDSHFLETLRGIRTIKLFNGQEGRRSHWLNLLVETTNRQLTTQKLRLAYRVGNSIVIGSLSILVVWIGAQQVLAGTFTVGMLLAFISYKDQFLDRVSGLIDKGLDLHMLRLHADRLADIALTAPEPRDPVATTDTGRVGPAALDVRDLRFRYSDNDPWVLDGVSFQVEPGECVALVGPSGCGKTTLLKVMASLFRPTSGEMLVNGTPLPRLGIERYRSMIGVVMQDDQLFAGSISDNICFFAEQPSHQRIEECGRQAAIHEEIMAMPMGYGTLIGDMGTVLSGGQKQRLLIARALYTRPAVLLLDEATSHLDLAKEKDVSAAIRSQSVTRIIVAHRPETILTADRVLYLHMGKVVKDRRASDGAIRALPEAQRALPEAL